MLLIISSRYLNLVPRGGEHHPMYNHFKKVLGNKVVVLDVLGNKLVVLGTVLNYIAPDRSTALKVVVLV